MSDKKPFHVIVSERLIQQLEEGTAPWQKPWIGRGNGVLPTNPTTGNRYKGINAIYLMAQSREDNRWMTYKQASSLGGQVRKGEKGTLIQYWKFQEEKKLIGDDGKPVLDDQGKPKKITVHLERPRSFMAVVFNAEQIDGLPKQPKVEEDITWDIHKRAEAILNNSGAKIKYIEGDTAFYRPSTDHIQLPKRDQFKTADNFYATALHELGHWSGHSSRLDRDLSHPFGSVAYAKEELRAEISSMILGEELGIGHDPGQHASYVGSWIKVLRDEPMEIFRAASDAEKIQDYLISFEQQQVQEVDRNQTAEVNMEQKELNEKLEQAFDSVFRNEEPSLKSQRIYLQVPFNEKESAKALGAKWDRNEQSWYAPPNLDIKLFSQWIGESGEAKTKSERIYLAVPYDDRVAAKKSGALWDKQAKSWYIGPKGSKESLSKWLTVTDAQDPALPPREEFTEALSSLGCIVEGEHPIMDGQSHRIRTEGDKSGEKAGFYVAHLDGHPAGFIQNNRTGQSLKWKAKGYSLDDTQKVVLKAQAAAKQSDREAEREQLQLSTAESITQRLESLIPLTEEHNRPLYLIKKGIGISDGIYTDQDGGKTFIPAYDVTGKVWTMQTIHEDGTKRFAKNSRKEGCFHVVGGFSQLEKAPAIVVCEGYATASSVSKALEFGFPVIAAFDSSNIAPVASALKEQFNNKPIIIVGDDDRHLELTQGINPGREKAEKAAKLVDGSAVFPVFTPNEAQYPAGVERVTPEKYKAGTLTESQKIAISRMKEFTDFNDMAIKSTLGEKGLQRQLSFALTQALNKSNQLLQEAQVVEKQRVQKKEPRAVRI